MTLPPPARPKRTLGPAAIVGIVAGALVLLVCLGCGGAVTVAAVLGEPAPTTAPTTPEPPPTIEPGPEPSDDEDQADTEPEPAPEPEPEEESTPDTPDLELTVNRNPATVHLGADDNWTNCKATLTTRGFLSGNYTHGRTLDRRGFDIVAGTPAEIAWSDFTGRGGERFNPATHEPQTLVVDCTHVDTDRSRAGTWAW